jgi:hypothetical protein
MNVVSLSALRTGRIYPPGNIPESTPWREYATGRVILMKNSNDIIGDRLVAQCLNQLRHHAPPPCDVSSCLIKQGEALKNFDIRIRRKYLLKVKPNLINSPKRMT